MTVPQAFRIYHNDALNKTEVTTSPARVKKAREDGLTVVELFEGAELALDSLSDYGRYEVFRKYCAHCGAKDPQCQCWNDE